MRSKILAVVGALLMVLAATPPVLAQVTSTPQTSGGIAGTSVFPSLQSTAPGGVTGFGTVGAPGTTIQNGVGPNGVVGQNGVFGSGTTSPGTTFGSTTPGTTNGTVGAGGTATGGGAAGIPGGGGSCDDAIFGVIC